MQHVDAGAIAGADTAGAERLGVTDARVPPRALVISVLALAVPVAGTVVFPEWVSDDLGMLVWLTALVPAFLLTYHRGWWGISLALAAGMAALAVAQVLLLLLGLPTPSWPYLLIGAVLYLAICLGAGVMAEILRRARDEAVRMALTDEGTGLANRRHASLFLASAYAAAERGHPLTVVLFDIDDLRGYNNHVGHLGGDEVLRRFGRILEEHTRTMNHSARVGGDEFISILCNSRLEGAEVFVSRVVEAFRAEEFPGGRLTVSAGVAEYSAGMQGQEDLVQRADEALARCKEAGGDGYKLSPRHAGEENDGSEQQALRRGPPRKASGEDPKHGQEASEEPERWPGGDERILLVESDHNDRSARTAFLEQLGYRVSPCSSGQEALGRLEEDVPDLLVVRDELEDMSGLALAARAEGSRRDLRVVYLSHLADRASLWKGAPGTETGLVPLPIDSRRLARTIRQILDAPAGSHHDADALSAGQPARD